MVANYHTHTKYCHHADGEIREYLDNAVKAGLKICGFSDHMPFAFPEDGYECHHRVSVCEAEKQMKELHELRKEYEGKIEMPIGYELEYYPAYFDEMLAYAKKLGAEYLILGQHYFYDDRKGRPRSMKETKSVPLLKLYVDLVIEALDKGVFSYIAHPDIIWFTGSRETYDQEMRRLIKKAKETDTPLEINLLGIVSKRFYPHNEFWRLVAEEGGCRVCIGIDAHGPERFEQAWALEKAMKIVKKYNLNYVDEMELRKL